MKILLIGATGKLGRAVNKALSERGHDVVSVSRRQGDLRFDISVPEQVTEMYDRVGAVDAVVNAAGETPYKPLAEMSPDDYLSAFHGKVLSQIELVRQGIERLPSRGSFTLITGILGREPVPAGSAASMANGAVEAFVRASAIEIAPQRINAVSPSLFTESVADYDSFFPGIEPVDLDRVGRAYVRSVEGRLTGRVFVLP